MKIVLLNFIHILNIFLNFAVSYNLDFSSNLIFQTLADYNYKEVIIQNYKQNTFIRSLISFVSVVPNQ